jgi:hypothetical protein
MPGCAVLSVGFLWGSQLGARTCGISVGHRVAGAKASLFVTKILDTFAPCPQASLGLIRLTWPTLGFSGPDLPGGPISAPDHGARMLGLDPGQLGDDVLD